MSNFRDRYEGGLYHSAYDKLDRVETMFITLEQSLREQGVMSNNFRSNLMNFVRYAKKLESLYLKLSAIDEAQKYIDETISEPTK